jgi:hypothetical protein
MQFDDLRLLVDPWVEGSAFDDGWLHISPGGFTPERAATCTHIWISHEHPDHFSPSFLRGIPEAARSRIRVLYQTTKDGKVAKFCRAAGFSVVEMKSGRWVTLSPGVEAACATWSGGDACLGVRAGGTTILNLNDCVIADQIDARRVARRLGLDRIDVLLTQFSYANWVGNPDAVDRRRAEANEKLERIRDEATTFKPRYIIPFASFVWFAHQENSWANDEAVTVARAASFIETETEATPVVLYPADRWTVGDTHDNTCALDRYEKDRAAALNGPLISGTAHVPIDELRAQAAAFWTTLEERNGTRVLRVLAAAKMLRPATIWVTDLGQAVRFERHGRLGEVGISPEDADIALTSSVLSFCFTNLYGGATLLVNGRFTSPPGGSLSNFTRWLDLANRNNRGLSALSVARERATRVAGRAVMARRRVPVSSREDGRSAY